MKNLKIVLALLVVGAIAEVIAGRGCRNNGRRVMSEGCSGKRIRTL